MELTKEIKAYVFSDKNRGAKIYFEKSEKTKKWQFRKVKFWGVKEPFYTLKDWYFLRDVVIEIDKINKKKIK